MKIKCWGSRGSIAVAGSEYSKFGGETTCIQVIAKSGENVIIDAGTGIRKLGIDLDAKAQRKIYILLTHAHWDHISGFTFLNLSKTPTSPCWFKTAHFPIPPLKKYSKASSNPPFFPSP